MTLGEQTAASVLRHMEIEEVQKLGSAMAGLADVPRERVTDVLGQLLVAVHAKTPIGIGTNDYLKKVMTDSLGERRAGALLGRIFKGRESTGIDALKWMEPRAVAEIVKREHPQIVATILAHLPSQQAADVLKELDAATQADIAMRMARLDEVPETALQELDGIVERQTKEATTIKTAKLGGVKAAADMINLLGNAQSTMIEAIQAEDAELGELIKDALFVFDNLLDIDDRGMQAVLREVQADRWPPRSRAPTRRFARRSSRTCRSVPRRFCATTSRRRVRCACPRSSRRRRRFSPSCCGSRRKARSCSTGGGDEFV